MVKASLQAFSSGEIPLTPDVERTTVLFPETNPETVTKIVSVEFNAFNWFELYDTLGLGALKFFLLRVDPKKKMVFRRRSGKINYA
jgi:hypothetical protein